MKSHIIIKSISFIKQSPEKEAEILERVADLIWNSERFIDEKQTAKTMSPVLMV